MTNNKNNQNNQSSKNNQVIVCVVDKHGTPLMPTRNCKKVRLLLESGRAVPINNTPFTIQLTYEISEPVMIQPIHLGIDTGRENIGIAISTDTGELIYAEELSTNNKSIKQAMQDRKMHRVSRHRHKRLKNQRRALKAGNEMKTGVSTTLQGKQRPRFKSKRFKYPGMEESVEHKIIKGAEAKFNNRKRPAGWLTPSGRQLIQMHLNTIKRLGKYFPITDVHIERVSFDFQKLENEDIEKLDYNKGPLYGYDSYKDFINDEQQGRCLLCGAHKIEQYHHIVYKSKDGSNTIKNIAGLCTDCHSKVHNNLALQLRLKELKEGTKTKYKISLLNSVMPQLLEVLDNYCKENSLNFHITTGYETSERRKALKLRKEHFTDAYIISLSNRFTEEINVRILTKTLYKSRRYKKKSKNIIHQLNADRIYRTPDGIKLYNRHSSMTQDINKQSLHDYMEEKFGDDESEKSRFAKTLKVEKRQRTYTKSKTKDNKHIDLHIGDIVYMTRAKKRRDPRNKPKGSKDGVYIIQSIDKVDKRLKLKNLKGETLSTAQRFCKKLRTEGCVTIHECEPIGSITIS